MLIRTHIGVSLDGFITDANGLPAWDAMENFGPGAYGHDEFTAGCSAVVIGRTTFDQGWPFWTQGDWPYAGKTVYVLTSRPLSERAPEFKVVPSNGGVPELLARLRSEVTSGDTHLLGGAATIKAFMDLGALDLLGMVLLPVRLGSGIPLLPTTPVAFSNEAWEHSLANPSGQLPGSRLNLERHRVHPDGAIELFYSFPR
jgi:dihydrofolate reductase